MSGQMRTHARLVLATESPHGGVVSTFEVTCPLHAWVHLLTHRMLSRNARSMRATKVPYACGTATWIPDEWPVENGRMAPVGVVPVDVTPEARATWVDARDACVRAAMSLADMGVHRSVANRLLAPFQFVRGIVTATEWENFIRLRTAADAQREIAIIASDIREALAECIPVESDVHLPLVRDDERRRLGRLDSMRLSAARCARVSYGRAHARSVERDLALADRLLRNGHMSPFEHACVWREYVRSAYNLRRGWASFRWLLDHGEA